MPRLNGTIDFDDVASAKAASASWWDEQDFDKIYIKDFGLYDFELTSSATPDDAVILIDGGYLIKITNTNPAVLTAGYGLSLLNGVFSRTYESGDVIQRKAYSGTTALSGDTAAFTSRTMTMPTFTPKSVNSTIDISIDADYVVLNYGTDEFQVRVMDGATTIFEKRQRWHNAQGGGTRSPTLLPLQCVVNNTSLTARNFTLQINRTGGNDTCQLYGYRAVVFTESQI